MQAYPFSLYRAAAVADEDDEVEDDEGSDPDLGLPEPVLYRADISTMVALHFVTAGLSNIYWGYRHWFAHQQTYRRRISPFWRGWFMLFYTHALFRSIDARARIAGMKPRWQPNSQAWLFVSLMLVQIIFGEMDNVAGVVSVWLICHVLRVFPLIAAQRLSNQAHRLAANSEDEDDEDEDDEEVDGDEDEAVQASD